MNRIINPGARHGFVSIPASKSQAHRLLICAALGTDETELVCGGTSADIEATVRCLNALGAEITKSGADSFSVKPIENVPSELCVLHCGESGSTLRFLLPLVGALGAKAEFIMEGRLPQRPLAPLDAVLSSHGMRFEREGNSLRCSGRLSPGEFDISGEVSSQYISGLLMALPRLEGESRLAVTGRIESAGYIAMTEDALKLSEIKFEKHERIYNIPGAQRCAVPAHCRVEGDWSNAAFFLAIGALSDEGVTVTGLNLESSQGDSAVLGILRDFGAQIAIDADSVTVRRAALKGVVIDAAPIPDLIPVLSVVAAAAEGETRVINAARLRLKESDRLSSTARLLAALGADVREQESGLIIRGGALTGGRVDSFRDHRIAMSAAVAACAASGAVELMDSECVAKSYPLFWEDFDALEGGRA